ncbi:MAG: TonB-dependent receptor plug domain-containing protein, partial [Desulfobacterales bacterium]|nr:TonB-dependent receptor plug domain-containing protein [Desulfobacterales bacterium]
MKKWLSACFLCSVLLFPLSGFAENRDTLDDVVVTATKTESNTGSIGGISASVISAADIDAKKQTSVDEVLKGVPGLDIVQTGGDG